jgi:hypothetical protein
MMESISIVSLIQHAGFPIAMTFYLLYRFEKRMENLEREVSQLRALLQGRKEG